MTFPSRGCRTCKQRHVKCDETRPVCKRCQKANRICQGVGNLIFLDENEYAVGQRKRPRGPNVNSRSATQSSPQRTTSITPEIIAKHTEYASPIEQASADQQSFSIQPAIDTPLDDQALIYYSRYHVEDHRGFPEIVDSHSQYALIDWCYSQPTSILSLSISALAHAIFGQAQKSHAALAASYSKCSKALVKINLALKDASETTHDGVFLAVMLLGYFENTVINKTSQLAGRSIPVLASRCFAHHDGAIAMLKMRRQLDQRSLQSVHLDKLIRRSLIRSCFLRSKSPPHWLRDGSQYGEHGPALVLDHCMVETAALRHQADNLTMDVTGLSESDAHYEMERLRRLLTEAETLEGILASWAIGLPPEDWYSSHTLQNKEDFVAGHRIFEDTVHIYATLGHAAMWNRFRTVHLAINDAMIKILSALAIYPNSDIMSLKENVEMKARGLANDLCASVPYILGLIEVNHGPGHGVTVVSNVPPSLKTTVKPSTAALLCWPLTMATVFSGIPEQHRLYLRNRLLDLSEITGDGMLARIAARPPGT